MAEEYKDTLSEAVENATIETQQAVTQAAASLENMTIKAPELSFSAAAEGKTEVVNGNAQGVSMAAVQAAPPPEAASLTPEELAQVERFVKEIDITNSSAVMNYGVGTQQKIADFSEKALENVRTKDLGKTGDMISTLVSELKTIDDDEEEKGFLGGFFKKREKSVAAMKAKYSKVESNVETIKNELETRQIQLMKDNAMLDQMYEMNQIYFKELSMYILAGKKKLEEIRTTTLPEMQRKAEESGLAEDAQAAKDMANLYERFEKKIYDLELTRNISLQTAPQIRMVQSSNTLMAEKIQSTIVNTIPLWKNQMIIAMGVEHSMQAAKAQREVSEMTNELLKKNADALQTATIETVKESERGIIDIETLQHTNKSLIDTLNEVLRIQDEGRERRVAAEAELANIETQLRQKLIEASRRA